MIKKEFNSVRDCTKYKNILKKEIQEKYAQLMKNLNSDEEFLELLKNRRIVVYKDYTNIVIYYDGGVVTGQLSAADSILYSCPFDVYEKAIALEFFNSKKFEKWKKSAMKDLIKSTRKVET